MNFWDNDKMLEPEFSFMDLDKEGTPCFFKVKDWSDVKLMTFVNANGQEFTSNFLNTNKGLLRVDSSRLQKQLKPFADKDEKRELTIQRWIEGKDNRSAVYKVVLHTGVTSTRRKPPTKK